MSHCESTDAPRIALIDSSAESNDLFQTMMATFGLSVRTFTSPELALLRLPAIAPDVIVMSILLHRVSGFQVCGRLRRMREIRGSTIIALTGLRYPGIEDVCKEAGFDEYMLKPISLEMVERIVQLTHRRRAEQERMQERENRSDVSFGRHQVPALTT